MKKKPRLVPKVLKLETIVVACSFRVQNKSVATGHFELARYRQIILTIRFCEGFMGIKELHHVQLAMPSGSEDEARAFRTNSATR